MSRFKLTRNRSLDARDMVFDADAENRSQRAPVVLIADTSYSMKDEPIGRLNEALAELQEDLHHDIQLSGHAEVCLITFGEGGVIAWRGDMPAPAGVSPFMPASQFRVPELRAGGTTPMVEAIELGIRLVAEHKRLLRSRSLTYYRPVLWCVSDGEPTDAEGQYSEDWRRLPVAIPREEQAKRLAFFTVSVGNISARGDQILQALAPKSHLKLAGFEFAEVMQLMSASVGFANDPIDAMKAQVAALAQRAIKPV